MREPSRHVSGGAKLPQEQGWGWGGSQAVTGEGVCLEGGGQAAIPTDGLAGVVTARQVL